MNINTLDSDKNTEDYINILCEYGYKSFINELTRPNKDGGTCIDHFFMRTERVVDAYILEETISDHYVIVADLHTDTRYSAEKEKRTFVNINKLKKLSKKVRWCDILSINDVNECTNELPS